MRNFIRFSSLLAVLSVGAAACGDDKDEGTTTDTAKPEEVTSPDTSDATNPTETTTTPPTDATQETTPTDPCKPTNPCTTPPEASCDGNSTVTFSGPGTCTNEGGVADCDYGSGTKTACAEGKVCSGGACIDGGDVCEYTFSDRVSYVYEIRVGNQNKPQGSSTYVDECCFDLGGKDSGIDNQLGILMGAIGGLVQSFDLNSNLKDQIASGSLTLLLETAGVDNLTTQSNVTLNGFYGKDGDADKTNNATGMSSFIVDPKSFVEGTKTPLINFTGASIANGVLSAGPAIFRLSIPILGARVDLAVSQTRLEATVAQGPNGKGLTMDGTAVDPDTQKTFGAKLGGSVKLEELATALNNYITTSCSCIEDGNTATPGIFTTTETATTVKIACEAGYKTDKCTADDCAIASQLALVCTAGPALINPDIDLDEDGVKESLSVGVFLKATSATVSGVDTCE